MTSGCALIKGRGAEQNGPRLSQERACGKAHADILEVDGGEDGK